MISHCQIMFHVNRLYLIKSMEHINDLILQTVIDGSQTTFIIEH